MFKQTGSAGGHLNPTSPMSLNTGQAKRAVKMLMYGVQEFGVRFRKYGAGSGCCRSIYFAGDTNVGDTPCNLALPPPSPAESVT